MIFDIRQSGLRHVFEGVRRVCAEAPSAHVYVRGWIVTVLREYRPIDSYIGSYDGRAGEEHVMSDVAAELGATVRRRK